MILDFQYWWKQFNGPRITAIMRAILQWMKEKWDDKLEYFWNFSIETANSSHLTFLGIISGFVRTVMSEVDETYFYFSNLPVTPGSRRGFSYRPGPSEPEGDESYDWGGQFSETSYESAAAELVPDEWFRALLICWSMSDGEEGSLKLLDDLITTVAHCDNEHRNYYFFDWYDERTTSKAIRDIDLYLDDVYDWSAPLTIYTIFSSLANTLYAPVPRVFPILNATSSGEYAVKTMLQFLSQDDLYIAQVLEDTPYTLTEDDFPDMPGVTWNTEKDGTGTEITVGYTLEAINGIIYAYPIEP